MGWFSPWQAAWINLRAMFVYGADFFVFRPGLAMLFLGLLLTLPLSLGPITIGPITFSLYWMLFGLTLSILGLQSFYFGCLAQVLCDYSGAAGERWLCVFRYTRSVFASVVLCAFGVVLLSFLVRRYVLLGFSLSGDQKPYDHLAVTGLLLIIVSYLNFVFTLLLHAASIPTRPGGVAE
jgi:hypothetical protein